jgi:hypothetical protein
VEQLSTTPTTSFFALSLAALLAATTAADAETVAAPAEEADAETTGRTGDAVEIPVFDGNVIHFAPDDASSFDGGGVRAESDGRVIVRTVELPTLFEPARITAVVTTGPIPKDEISVNDPWDRAGNVRLSVDGAPDIELVKFVTAYGGVTEHEVDVSHLAPVLQGACTFRGFVDTWVTPGWKMDFALRFEPADEDEQAGQPYDLSRTDWCRALVYEESLTDELMAEGPLESVVDVPEGTERVLLYYLSSGHCTDGTGADEFISKDNVVAVDGTVVHRFRPWRADCRRFRDVNPYTRRWSDGWWSSDYGRSGWCPGDSVAPAVLDLTDHLTPGRHTVTVAVEDVRPRNEDGHFGYWRVSGYVVGWESR